MQDLNNQILDLWEHYHNDINLNVNNQQAIPYLWPTCYYHPPENVEILFVGLNPSDSFPGVANVINQAIHNPLFQNLLTHDFVHALDYQANNYTSQDIAELEELAFYNHNYFNKFRNLGNYILNGNVNNNNNNYYHIDLYQFRLQNSTIFQEIKNNNQEFFNAQFQISCNAIERLNPRIIFVANRYASDDFIEFFSPTWNGEKGCYVISNNNLNSNVFLSGMITQTRAIDNYSFERLKWHIKKIYNNYIMKSS